MPILKEILDQSCTFNGSLQHAFIMKPEKHAPGLLFAKTSSLILFYHRSINIFGMKLSENILGRKKNCL